MYKWSKAKTHYLNIEVILRCFKVSNRMMYRMICSISRMVHRMTMNRMQSLSKTLIEIKMKIYRRIISLMMAVVHIVGMSSTFRANSKTK